jgi:putative membrane protein (TIGR04086 family)
MYGNPAFGALRAIMIGAVTGAAICAALLGALALLFVSAGHIPQGMISPLIIALSVFSSFAAGFVCARISRKMGLIYGALSGLFLFALFLVSGLIASHEALSVTAGIRMIVMTLSGALGGAFGVSRKSKIK